MSSDHNRLTFTVPLTSEAHCIAQEFYKQHSNAKKAKQIYLNTLAVYAVNFYLECLGVETDLAESDSWDQVMQTLTNTADLVVKGMGKLECLAVLPKAQDVTILPELDDRIGYVAVQLNQELTEATLLGFIPEIATDKLSLSKLKSLEYLIEHLNNPTTEAQRSHLTPEIVKLSDWLHNAFNVGWETVERLFASSQNELAMNFRKAPSVQNAMSKIPEDGVKRGKRLDLKWGGEQLALLIGVKSINSTEVDITIEVYPTGEQIHLPVSLQLMVLDETGGVVMQATTTRGTESMELKFNAESGEKFGVKVALGDVSITEEFLI